MTEDNRSSIFDSLYELASTGNARAQYLVARCFLSGRGVEADRDLGVMWLHCAVHGGSARAARLLVKVHCEEHVSRVELEKATDTTEALNAITYADKPNLLAETTTDAERVRLCEVLVAEADRLSKVDKNDEAAELLLQAARYGYKRAQAQIARWYACGRGVEPDSSAATYWRECAGSSRPLL